jgi:hypothetical protein
VYIDTFVVIVYFTDMYIITLCVSCSFEENVGMDVMEILDNCVNTNTRMSVYIIRYI